MCSGEMKLRSDVVRTYPLSDFLFAHPSSRRLRLDHPPHARALDRPGADGVDPDAKRPELDRQAPGQADHRPFGGRIRRAQRITHEPGGRRDVDDRPAARSLEQRDGAPGAQERPQIDRDAAPPRRIEVSIGPVGPAIPALLTRTSRPPKVARSPRTWHRPRPRAQRRSGSAEPRMRVFGRGERLGIDVADPHPRALGEESGRDRPPDTGAARGHQHPFARDPPFLLPCRSADVQRAYTASSAWARSAIRSSGCSTPTDRRIIAGVMPSSAWRAGGCRSASWCPDARPGSRCRRGSPRGGSAAAC